MEFLPAGYFVKILQAAFLYNFDGMFCGIFYGTFLLEYRISVMILMTFSQWVEIYCGNFDGIFLSFLCVNFCEIFPVECFVVFVEF